MCGGAISKKEYGVIADSGGREHVQSLTAQLRLGPADILESDENGIIPEQDRVITQVVILDADKKQIQCVVRPLQILRADGTWENIGGMK
ncbi:TPA: phage tail fiber C-terminal domain-containing protein [Escherichia coli]